MGIYKCAAEVGVKSKSVRKRTLQAESCIRT